MCRMSTRCWRSVCGKWKCVWKELGREGVRVNSIRPGVIETEIHAAYGEPERPYKIGASTPLGRPGTANEIAEAIVWLLSDASSYVTGAIIDVTGGR